MAESEGKKASDSYTEREYIVQTEHLNSMGTLFGGQLMSWMDAAAGAAGIRYSSMPVTMVAVDDMQIKAPAYPGDKLVYKSRVTHVGTTSMEILVEIDIEDTDKGRRTISQAYFIGVALDDDGRPAPAPPLLVETSEEQKHWEDAEKRKALRAKRREMGI